MELLALIARGFACETAAFGRREGSLSLRLHGVFAAAKLRQKPAIMLRFLGC